MKGNYRNLAHNKKVNYDGFNLKLNTNKEQWLLFSIKFHAKSFAAARGSDG